MITLTLTPAEAFEIKAAASKRCATAALRGLRDKVRDAEAAARQPALEGASADRDLIARIQETLSGKEWSADTIEILAILMTEAGYKIANYEPELEGA